MKRQNLIIMLIVIVALWSCGAVAKEVPYSEPNEEYIPCLSVQPGSKFEPYVPNEGCIPGLTVEPYNKVEPTTPNEGCDPSLIPNPGAITPYGAPTTETPSVVSEKAPITLQPLPTQPQLAPAPPPRGVTPIPPPQQGPGGGWADRLKPSKWMWVAKLINAGD